MVQTICSCWKGRPPAPSPLLHPVYFSPSPSLPSPSVSSSLSPSSCPVSSSLSPSSPSPSVFPPLCSLPSPSVSPSLSPLVPDSSSLSPSAPPVPDPSSLSPSSPLPSHAPRHTLDAYWAKRSRSMEREVIPRASGPVSSSVLGFGAKVLCVQEGIVRRGGHVEEHIKRRMYFHTSLSVKYSWF